VRDPARAQAFYGELLGLETDGRALVAPRGTEPLLVLEASPDAPPRRPRTGGLFHLALLVPTRAELAAVLLRLAQAGVPLQGASDHGVSEALYLADPEGNGLEIYADRPREAWPREGGMLALTTDPLDVQGLVGEARGRSAPLPPGTVVGHVHLRAPDLRAAEVFYGPGGVGLEVTVRDYPGARFFAAGGYHHHLGVNDWGVSRVAEDGALGLLAWTLAFPDRASASAAAGRVGAEAHAGEWRVRDPAGNVLLLTRAPGP
jgi:catechol 2,3-dioxygenase